MPYTRSRAASLSIATPISCADSRYQSARQLRQKPARVISSMFCTSRRASRWASRRRKAAASKAVESGRGASLMWRSCHTFGDNSKIMGARILDGKRIADALLDDLAIRVEARVAAGKPRPGLAVVLVGADPASAVYVRNKRKAGKKVGIHAFDHDLPADTTEAQLGALIDQLNADPKVHGILVQLPLPGISDASRLIERIDPRKDVDGFHPENVGHLALRQFGLRPCTPRGITT